MRLVMLWLQWGEQPGVQEADENRGAAENQRERDRLAVAMDEEQTREHRDDPGRHDERLDRGRRHWNAELLRGAALGFVMHGLRIGFLLVVRPRVVRVRDLRGALRVRQVPERVPGLDERNFGEVVLRRG